MMKIEPYFSNLVLCLLRVLSKRWVKNRSASFEYLRARFVAGSRSFKMKNAGAMLPRTPMTNACHAGRPIAIPIGMPIRSSSPGRSELRKVASSGVR